MPGIVGIITKLPRRVAEARVACMLATLDHESFYTSGSLADEPSGVYAGWVSLKGAFSEKMPVRNERGNIALMFSGEEFPDPATVQRLRSQGHEVDSTGPSYLVHLSEEDPSFPAGLNGRFHGLLTERNCGTAVLFNDRFGMHRIYYHQSQEAFYFAAEAKAILSVCPELRSMDPRGIGEFVSCGTVLEDRTLFAGIHILPPASAWTFRSGSIEAKRTYFDPKEWEEQQTLDHDSYYQELRRTLTSTLSRYFDGPQRIGMSLTGGLDTRMILACRKPDPGSLPCYTFGSMFRENEDVRVAKRVAEVCKQPHQVITAGPEFLSDFARYAERAVYLTDSCVEVSRAPDLYLNEKARNIAPVRMTGNYGGEVLRGVRAFKPIRPAQGLFRPEFVSYVLQAERTFAQSLNGHPVSFAAFQQARWSLYGVLALEQTQLTMRSPYLDNEFVRTVFRSPVSALGTDEVSLRLIADGNQDLQAIPTDHGVGGNRGRILGTMSRGLLKLSFKAEYAYDMGMPHWLAAMNRCCAPVRIERVILGRHKPFHFRVWYRDALAKYVREILLDPRTLSRPYIDRKGLVAIVRGHLGGMRNYTTELHKLLTLELAHRAFIDSQVEGRTRKGAFAVAETCPN